MKKRKTAAFLAALMICAWVPQAVPGDSGVLVAEAHSGRTDRYGGHRDNKNKSGLGSYHYHCGGHPAHLHENGICPYHPMWRRLLQRFPQRRRLRRRRRICTWSLIPSTTRITIQTFTRPLDMIQTSSRSTSSPAA